MFKKRSFLIAGIVTATLLISTHFLKASDDLKPFLGFWALTLPNDVPGWIEIRQESGYLDGDILWGWGSVVPLSNVYLDGDKLVTTRTHNIVRKRDDDGNPADSASCSYALVRQKKDLKIPEIA